MKRIALLLAATAFSAPAMAADVIYDPQPAAFTPAAIPVWSGFYAGVQAGGAFNPSSPDRLGIVTNGFAFDAPGAVATTPGNPTGSLEGAFGDSFSSTFDSGFVGGAHVGYDWQIQNFVVGGILDINATDITVRQSAFSSTPAFYTAERDLDFLATARLRAGYLVTPTTLAYATGGLAYGDISYSFSSDSGPFASATVFDDSGSEWGYTVGGGVELLVTENVSFGVEYLYTNLGDDNSFTRFVADPFDGPGGGGSTDFVSGGDFDFHTITAKLSYRFN